MAYKIRVILNVKEDIIRDIAISETKNLENLHHIITSSFGFTGKEMASFYQSDEEWVQGEEFPLFDMSEGSNGITQMQDIAISKVLQNKGDKLIYVYDFFNMWSFYVDVIDTNFDLQKAPSEIVFSLGSIPSKAPAIQFESQDLSGDDDFDEEDDFDEFDFENFEEL